MSGEPSPGNCRRFAIDPGVLRLFPGMTIVGAVVRGVDNRAAPESLDAAWADAWRAAGDLDVPNAQSHPSVRALRERFKDAGVSVKRFPTSIEAMLRRALKGGEPFRINPLVDLYNALSLTHVCPAGAFDLDALSGPLELRFTRDGDTFTALDADGAVDVDPGEIAYANGTVVLTRHFMWRQSRQALVGPATCDAVLVAEIPGELGRGAADAFLDDLRAGLERHFGPVSAAFSLDEDEPVAEW